MKIINFIMWLLIVIDIIGIIYVKRSERKIDRKIDEIDNVLFEHMREEHNSKVNSKLTD